MGCEILVLDRRYWFGMQLPLQTLEFVREEWGRIVLSPPNYRNIPTLYGKKSEIFKNVHYWFSPEAIQDGKCKYRNGIKQF